MSADDDSKSFPQSIRHQRILDVAEEHPKASINDVASRVTSATPELVERVLEKYGDPGAEADSIDTTDEPMSSTNEPLTEDDVSETDPTPSEEPVGTDDSEPQPSTTATETDSDPDSDLSSRLDELSETKRELLEVVAAQPEATQKQIADHFDVTRATVSRWASNITGFDWTDRKSIIESVFDDPPSIELRMNGDSTTENESEVPEQVAESRPGDGGDSETIDDIESTLDQLDERVRTLENASDTTATSCDSAFEDPELVHKVVHACMNSELISESEELRILKQLLK